MTGRFPFFLVYFLLFYIAFIPKFDLAKFIAVSIIGIVISLVILKSLYEKAFTIITTLMIVFVIVLIIPIIINESYRDNTGYLTLWEAKDVLSFYGSFLSFAGTVTLGIILFFNEKHRIISQAKINGRIIYEINNYIDRQLNLIENDCQIIRYDIDWKKYFFIFSELQPKYFDEYLNSFSRKIEIVDNINNALLNKDVNKAKEIYENYKLDEQYSIKYFNHIEVALNIATISSDYFTKEAEPWNRDLFLNDKVKKLSDKYYHLVENWIYNKLISSDDNVIEIEQIEVELAEWLLKSKELMNLVKSPYDKRIIVKVIINISHDFKKKSRKIYYVWNEYHLKDEN